MPTQSDHWSISHVRTTMKIKKSVKLCLICYSLHSSHLLHRCQDFLRFIFTQKPTHVSVLPLATATTTSSQTIITHFCHSLQYSSSLVLLLSSLCTIIFSVRWMRLTTWFTVYTWTVNSTIKLLANASHTDDIQILFQQSSEVHHSGMQLYPA